MVSLPHPESVAVSDDEDAGEDGYVEPTGPFQPAAHDGIPVTVPGRYREGRYGRIGRQPHPPLACPDPRLVATLRGFYRCPACGEKVPLSGQVSAAQTGQEAGEMFAAALAGGVAQAYRLTVEIARDMIWAVRWVCWWVGNRGAARRKRGRADPEMVRALVVMGMVAARNRPVQAPETGHELNV